LTNSHFDAIAGLYNKWAVFSLTDDFLHSLAIPCDGIMLDIGGGTGRVAEAVRSMVKAVIVIDISLAMMRHAVGKDLSCVDAPSECLPFPTESVDRVLMLDSLHHVQSQQMTVGEIWRVLKPGGRIVIVEPNIHLFQVKILAVGEKLLLMRSHILSGEKIARLFDQPSASIKVEYAEKNVLVVVDKC
jgi:ubiquinone/menaquinone biosynthesis C-methylase UbiE